MESKVLPDITIKFDLMDLSQEGAVKFLGVITRLQQRWESSKLIEVVRDRLSGSHDLLIYIYQGREKEIPYVIGAVWDEEQYSLHS